MVITTTFYIYFNPVTKVATCVFFSDNTLDPDSEEYNNEVIFLI